MFHVEPKRARMPDSEAANRGLRSLPTLGQSYANGTLSNRLSGQA